jgi:tight adherence protein C
MGLPQWLFVLAMLAWSAGLAAAVWTALGELEPAAFQARAPLRFLRPGVILVAHFAGRRLRVTWRAEQMTCLLRAGLDRCLGPSEWFALQCVLAALAGCVALPLALQGAGLTRLAPLPASLVGWLLPEAWLRLRIRRRQRRIGRDLALYLDLLLAGLESGLVLRGALQLAVAAGPPGPLAVALTGSMQDACTGCEPDELLRRLQRRLQAPAASVAITAILKSHAAGAGLTRALQGAIARQARARLARAERCAQQAPRRMLRPLLACFAPSLIVASAVPAAARLLA